jgi:hypothetical protein
MMKTIAILALYGGPDQLMPLTSGLTAILAFVLIFWNKVLVTAGKLLSLFRRSGKGDATSESQTKVPPKNVDTTTVPD